ncbi:MAG: RNA polymerase factor sigma-54 [Oscillospiraceae bacterium]
MDVILEQKQVQKLSPQMIQSMEILQMSSADLQEYVEELLLENPVLEREETPPVEEGSQLLGRLEWLAAHSRPERSAPDEDVRNAADAVADPAAESLYDHLSAQVPWSKLSPALRRGVECVLSGLNGNGWLDESTDELAARGGVSPAVITRAEDMVRQLEPAGVGARTLAQCLELQLERRGEAGLALTIVRGHLEDMAKHHYNQIARATGAGRAEIQEACRLIRSLDPRPGGAFSGRETPGYITPDLLVAEESGQLVVCFADRSVPELKVSTYYRQLLHSSGEEQVQDYLAEKLRQADWVVKSIEQRRSTVLRCVRCIVARQEEFFRGVRGTPRPMTLADVAADTQMHESTVSRAVRDKYLQCARGLFPLNAFFSRALPSGQEDRCAGQAKAALRALIDREDKRAPLSDQKLCEALAGQDLILSRRTVAKYRDEMGIPSAPGRKEF